MILIIGGLASGKRDYVKNAYGYQDKDMADGILDGRPVIFNLQNLITEHPEAYESLLPELIEKNIVICNEIGSGIVPVDKKERTVREATGRLCAELAARAEKVVRVFCGIPLVIKDER